jgi:hypothetical protein
MRISTGYQVSILAEFVHVEAKHILGHEKKPEEKGISHIKPKRMDRPAITSV